MSLEDEVRALLSSGEEGAAATRVINAFSQPVMGHLRTVLRDPDDVEDAHAVWAENVWKGLPRFAWRSSLRTWAYRLALNVALNMRNEAFRRRVRRFETGEASALAASLRSSGASYERKRNKLDELRRYLTDAELMLVSVHTELELSWDQASEAFAEAGERVSADTLAKRWERLKDRMARLARELDLVD